MPPPMPSMFNWFIGPQTLFFVVFALITFLVGFYAFKIFKLTQNKNIKIFGISFFMFSLSYIIQLLIHIYVRTQFQEHFRGMGAILVTYKGVAILSEIVLFTFGLTLLTYMTFKTKDKRPLILTTLLLIIALFTSSNIMEVYHIISTILLAFISYFYFKNYTNHKQKQTLIVFIAFIFLMLGHMNFILTHNPLLNVVGSFLAMVAYLLILTNLILTLKK